MRLSTRSLLVRLLAVLPLLAFSGNAQAGSRRSIGIIIVINNDPKPIVSHL